MYKIVVLFAAAFCSSGQALAYKVERKILDTPSAPVAQRAVYGIVDFSVTRAAQSTQSKKLWQEVVQAKFGNNVKKGNYVVTLELKRGDETVGRQVIATYKIDQVINSVPILGGLLGYDSNAEQILTEANTQWNGRMYADSILVDEANNVLKVELATYYSDERDGSVKLFSAAANMINVVTGVPLLGLANVPNAAITNLANILDGQLFGADKKKLVSKESDSGLMSFISLNANQPYPKIVDYKLNADGANSPQMTIRVSFNTIPSKFPFNPGQGEFINPNADYILNIAKIDGRLVPEALKSLSDSSLGKFTAAWLSGNGYPGEDIATRCTDLRLELGKKMSSRDAAAVYWALLQNYSDGLKKSHADYKKCVESVRSTYAQMKLEFTNFEP